MGLHDNPVVARGLVLAFASALATSAAAEYASVDISSNFNNTWSDFANGSTFPTGNQVFTHGSSSVPVTLGGVDGAPSAWSAYLVASTGTVTLTVPVNLRGATTVFTMINSAWGVPQQGLASVTFHATGGLSQTFQLVGGTDIRDHQQGPNWTTAINGTTTQQVFANGMGQWLDMQRFDLDAAFAGQTLTSIVFTDNGMNGVQRLNLFGITAVVPGPGALALLGALGLSASRRRR